MKREDERERMKRNDREEGEKEEEEEEEDGARWPPLFKGVCRPRQGRLDSCLEASLA